MTGERRLLQRMFAKWPAVVVWGGAWLLMQSLDRALDLANLALILVFASALSAMWLGALESVLVCALAVMAFNWQFVPPRGTFSVDLRQHVLLLLVMLGVGSMVAWLTARQRALAQQAQQMAMQARLLHGFGEQLRECASERVADLLQQALQDATGQPGYVVLLGSAGPGAARWSAGSASADEQAHVEECLQSGQSTVAGIADVHGHQVLVLPLRGPTRCVGAAVVHLPAGESDAAGSLATAQALCDQTAVHCERTQAETERQQAEQEAQVQKVRNTLLASISHDYRTPLATILGAASSLLAQSERLSKAQVHSLLQSIVDEVEMLRGMTDNTLELSRLDSGAVQIHRDWESLEELIGSAVARARLRHAGISLHARVDRELPLLRCDAALVVQLINNLVDNAVKYGLGGQAIEIIARQVEGHILLAVADRGPGIPLALRERVFQPFERGTALSGLTASVRGAGLGLALCRAIMQAHGGDIQARSRQRGGTRMECRFPLEAQPTIPTAEEETP